MKQIFRFYPWRFLKMFLPILILLAISFWLNYKQWTSEISWPQIIMAIFFLFLIVFPIVLNRIYYLELDKAGFTIHLIGTKRFYHWYEVANFRFIQTSINHIPMGQKIVFDLRNDSPNKNEWIRASRNIRTLIPFKSQIFDTSFLNVFEPSSLELAKILNQYQEKGPIA